MILIIRDDENQRVFFINHDRIDTIVFDYSDCTMTVHYREEDAATFKSVGYDELHLASEQLEYSITHKHLIVDLSEFFK